MIDYDYIAKNIREIQERVNNAKLKRDTDTDVRLMAVTKTVPADKINFAVSCGIDLIGENRVSELLGKYDEIDKTGGLEIHFIGSLQTNKVRQIIDKVSMIQSVNSLRLAEEINKRADMQNKVMDILIEINIAGEENKIGISEAECPGFVDKIKDFKNIRVCGLMTIPPFEASIDANRTEIKKYFNKMQELNGRLIRETGMETGILSMGMSEDFEEAVQCGSDVIRIGKKIFGERKGEEEIRGIM